MPQALPLTDRISQSASRTRTPRVLSAQFNDGYSQDAPDGINPLVDSWSINYDSLTTSERNTLWAALDAVGSWDYFTWTPHGEAVSKKWKVTREGVRESFSSTYWNISFTLRQVF